MAEFRTTVTTMREEIVKELCSTMISLQTTMTVHANKITALETSHIAADNAKLKATVDDQENHSRRQNIRVIGLPEGEEGANPIAFIGSFLKEIMGEKTFANTPVIDSAHRTSAAKPLPGEPPRAMLVRLHYYQTKELILRTSRERGQLSYKGKRIHIFPDYSATLARRRAEFKDVKAQLYQAGVKFGLIHPAKLRITFQGSAHTFDTPDAALQFFRTTIQPTTK